MAVLFGGRTFAAMFPTIISDYLTSAIQRKSWDIWTCTKLVHFRVVIFEMKTFYECACVDV